MVQTLKGMAKGQAAGQSSGVYKPYKCYLPASVAGRALDGALAIARQYQGDLSCLLSVRQAATGCGYALPGRQLRAL